jgi:hypothetical protein
LGATKKRCDTVIYGSHAEPLMVIEYKSPNIEITQKVFEQICRYNIKMKVEWLVVSNGLQHYCTRIDYENGTYQFVEDIPAFPSIAF